jgi:polysaccharide biosynthesis protein PslG
MNLRLPASLALIGFCLACCPSPAADLPGPAVPGGLGVNIHFTDAKPGEMKQLAEAGVRWVRMDLAWAGTEREKGNYDFSAYDRLMADLERFNIRAIFILDYTNPHYDSGISPATDEGRAAFARWAVAAVKHFRGKGVIWEMYNEPNIGFWKPKPDVEHYIKLALAVGKALREAEPKEIYIGPATSEIDFKFLEACFQAGLLEYWRAVSVHPYRQTPPETVIADYAKLRQMIEKYAPKGKKVPIISGEWGYSETWKDFDEEKQGKYLARQFLINLSEGIPISIWYDWHDDGENPREAEHHFGAVKFPYQGKEQAYKAKPAYEAAKTLAEEFRGFTFKERLKVGGPEDFVLAFVKGKETRYAAWTTASGPREVTVPLKGKAYSVRDHGGKRLPQAKADANGLPLKLTDSPQYLQASDGYVVFSGGFIVPADEFDNDGFDGRTILSAGTDSIPALSLHPDNPRYLRFRGKSTVLVASSERYGAVMNTDFDYIRYLDELQAKGLNLTRTFSGVCANAGCLSSKPDVLAPSGGKFLCPWARGDTPAYADGGNRFDLTKWDDAYFKRLKDFVAQAGKRGIVVELVLFSRLSPDAWDRCPMKAANNINDIGKISYSQFFEPKDTKILELQQAVTRKIAEELRGCDNLYYEICEEPFSSAPEKWRDKIIEALEKTEGQWPADQRHLIAWLDAHPSPKLDPRISIVKMHHCILRPESMTPYLALNRRLVRDSTGSVVSEFAGRVEGWEFLMAGTGIYDYVDESFLPGHEDGSASVRSPSRGGVEQRAQLGILSRFLADFDVGKMAPDNTVARVNSTPKVTTRALVERGKQYAIYVRGDGLTQLGVNLPEGRYVARWVNPQTGKSEAEETFDTNGGRTFKVPTYAKDIALAIKRK